MVLIDTLSIHSSATKHKEALKLTVKELIAELLDYNMNAKVDFHVGEDYASTVWISYGTNSEVEIQVDMGDVSVVSNRELEEKTEHIENCEDKIRELEERLEELQALNAELEGNQNEL